MAGTDRLTFALFMGVALCVSALPVIAKMFLDMGLMNNKTCQLALVAATIDDAFGWMILSIVSAIVVVVVAIVGKFAGAYLGARLSNLSRHDALILGASLNSHGIIEVVIAMIGIQLSILTVEVYTMIVLVAIITSLMAPPILHYATKKPDPSG